MMVRDQTGSTSSVHAGAVRTFALASARQPGYGTEVSTRRAFPRALSISAVASDTAIKPMAHSSRARIQEYRLLGYRPNSREVEDC